jgi:hypothetical protein
MRYRVPTVYNVMLGKVGDDNPLRFVVLSFQTRQSFESAQYIIDALLAALRVCVN